MWIDLVAYQELPGLCAAGPCSRTHESASVGAAAVSPAPATFTTAPRPSCRNQMSSLSAASTSMRDRAAKRPRMQQRTH
eukprot:14308077-Alexandrium_andersonii.AAC.1